MNNLITKMLTLCLCLNVVAFAAEAKFTPPGPGQEKLNDYIEQGLARAENNPNFDIPSNSSRDGSIYLIGNDAYGDGWNGNELCIDGSGCFAVEGSDGSWELGVLSSGDYAVSCGGGSWQSEVSWVIADAAGNALLSGGAPFDGTLTVGDNGCAEADAHSLSVGGGSWGSEVGWSISGTSYAGSVGDFSLCLANGDYTFNMTDSYGDGWNGNTATITDSDGSIVASDGLASGASGSFGFTLGGPAPVLGCTDPGAPNYNSDATVDDGSCEAYCNSDELYSCAYYILSGYTCEQLSSWGYDCTTCYDSGDCPVLGCTDSEASNYNPDATIEDGTCEYPCSENDLVFNCYDSYGDGWNGASATLFDVDGNVVASGGLSGGSEGSFQVCVADGDYSLTVGGGSYDSEITWEFNGNTGAAGTYSINICGSGYDECGVCAGDNSSCADCAGTPNGDATEDNCGTCDNDPNNDCSVDCAGVYGGTAFEDCIGQCADGGYASWIGDGWCDDGAYGLYFDCDTFDCDNGDCEGACGCSDNTSCLDECGVPNGDNSSCADCAGVPNGDSVDDCDESGECWSGGWVGDGYCDGTDQAYGADLSCYDCDGGDCIDVCGECNGDGTSCLDCCGVAFGTDDCAGDFNTDGALNVSDIIIAISFILEEASPSDCDITVGDLNGDGTVNILDVIPIVEAILSYIETCNDTDCGYYIDYGYTCYDLVNQYGFDCSVCIDEGVDCSQPDLCGNGSCDFNNGETEENCPEDCISSDACSDCEYDFTNYGSECCDTAWGQFGINCAQLEANYGWNCAGCACPGDSSDSECGDGICDENEFCTEDCGCAEGQVADCVDGDCCPESWIGDGFADCEDQAYGCDLTCYDNDGGDCDEDDGDDGDDTGCADDQFTCDDGSCIPASYYCDGSSEFCNAGWGADCADGSDEGLEECGYEDECDEDGVGENNDNHTVYNSSNHEALSTKKYSVEPIEAQAPVVKKAKVGLDRNPKVIKVNEPEFIRTNKESSLNRSESSLQKANTVSLNQTSEGLTYEADGFVAFEITIEHEADFEINVTEAGFIAKSHTIGNTTKIVVINNETNELFTSVGEFEITEVIAGTANGEALLVDINATPREFGLSKAYPNPFNPTTSVELSMANDGFVSLKIYNLMGQVVANLYEGHLNADSYNFTWDASNTASGLYMIKAETSGSIATQKLMLLK